MNNNPLVSVIIGTKNRSKLLPRAINTVIGQTYQNWECLILDGASTDDTYDVVNKYSDKRIKYIKLDPDPGRIKTINYGIEKCNGSLICFLDDDDEFYKNKLELQVESFKNASEDVAVVYCWTNFYDEKSKNTLFICKNNIEGNVFYHTLGKMSLCSFPALMIRKDILLEVGKMPDKVDFPSDWQLVCRLTQKYRVKYVPEILVKVNKNHIYEQMSKPSRKGKNYYKKVSEWQLDFLSEFNEGYSQYPERSLVHIYPLISSFAITGQLKLMIKYYLKAIRINPINIQPHKKLISGFITRMKIQK